MAGRKHSQWSTVIAHGKEREEFFKRHGRQPFAPGYGLSYAFLPLRPLSGVAYLFRRYVSLYDAIREWRVQRPAKESEVPESQVSEIARAEETIPFRREVADGLLAALEEPTDDARAFCERPEVLARFYEGDKAKCLAQRRSLRDNYDAAERLVVDWCRKAKLDGGENPDEPAAYRWLLRRAHFWQHLGEFDCDECRLDPSRENPLDTSPKLRVARELERVVLPLIYVYRDPQKFFREIAPISESPDFDREKVGPFEHFAETGRLGDVLHEWGVAAVFNPNIRVALESATPEKLIRILGKADAKFSYEEGRKKASKDKRPRKRKPPQIRQNELGYLREIAGKEGLLDEFEIGVLENLLNRGLTWSGEQLSPTNLREFARYVTSSKVSSKK